MEFFDEFYAIMNAYAAPFMKLNKKIKIIALACLCVVAIQYILQKLPLLKQFLTKNNKQPKNADEHSSYYGEENANNLMKYPFLEEEQSLEGQFQKLDYAQERLRQPFGDSQQNTEIDNNNKKNPLKEFVPRNCQIMEKYRNQRNFETQQKQVNNEMKNLNSNYQERMIYPLVQMSQQQTNYLKPLSFRSQPDQLSFNQTEQLNAILQQNKKLAQIDRVDGILSFTEKPIPLFYHEQREKQELPYRIYGSKIIETSQGSALKMELENNCIPEQNRILQSKLEANQLTDIFDELVQLGGEDKAVDEKKKKIRLHNIQKQIEHKKDQQKKQRDNSDVKDEKQENYAKQKKKSIVKKKKVKINFEKSENKMSSVEQNEEETNSTNHSDNNQGNQLINQHQVSIATQYENNNIPDQLSLVPQRVIEDIPILNQPQQQQQQQQQQNQLPSQSVQGEYPRSQNQESYQPNQDILGVGQDIKNNNLSQGQSAQLSSNQCKDSAQETTSQKDVLPLPQPQTKWILNKESLSKNTNNYAPIQFNAPNFLSVDQFDHQDIQYTQKAEFNVYNEKLQKGYNVHVIQNNNLLVRPVGDEENSEQVDKTATNKSDES